MTTVMFTPESLSTVVVLRLPFPWRTLTVSMPDPLPSVTLAVRDHEVRLQLPEQSAFMLTASHTGGVISVTLKKQKNR